MFSVVPNQEPISIVTVRHMIRLRLNSLLLFMRHSSLHTAEELVILERGSFWFGLVGICIGEKPFEPFGRILGRSPIYKGDEKEEASSGPKEKKSLFFGSGGGTVSFLPMMLALEMEYRSTLSSPLTN